ncbi:MAG: dinitrogenase iron-molybdenum cofactor [Firmicutes bacterium]|nr:dinitrogenase iron-molybdenum cofactor [Bacillota bacterium]
MKIAIPTEQGCVAQHFGRCPEYTLVEIAEGKVASQEVIPSPGHQPGFLPGYLAERGVTCIITGGAGRRAIDLFNQNNIEVIIGITGPVEQAVEDYLAGKLTSRDSLCERGQGRGSGEPGPGGHGCN